MITIITSTVGALTKLFKNLIAMDASLRFHEDQLFLFTIISSPIPRACKDLSYLSNALFEGLPRN